MDGIYIHPRVFKRHPELREADVVSAWRNAIEFARRDTGDGERFVAVGSDANGRLIEMVALHREGAYLIFHAMTPPSKKTLCELRLYGR